MTDTGTAKQDFILGLLEDNTNEWSGSSEPEELMAAKYAVVIERDEDSWVRAANSDRDIALIELGCLVGTEGYDEWINTVYDLDVLDIYAYTSETMVRVNDVTVSTLDPIPGSDGT